MENRKNIEKPEILLTEWVTRLGLNDWTIRLETNVIPSDMITQDTDGEVEFTECNKSAVVRILNEKCYGKRITPFDFERILIHELLHLKFCLLVDDGMQGRFVHQLLDDMAKALVSAKRGTTTVGSVTCSEGE